MLRRTVLSEEPFCRHCMAEGIYERATDVDHIIAAKPSDELFYKMSNLQPLCHSCHAKKTATQDGGFGTMPSGGEGRGQSL